MPGEGEELYRKPIVRPVRWFAVGTVARVRSESALAGPGTRQFLSR